MKTADDSLKKQNKVIEERYRAQIATVNAAAQAAVRTEQQAAQARISALQQGVQAAQVTLQNSLYAENAIRNTFYSQSIQAATVWANQLQFLTQYAFGLTNTGGSGSGGGIGGRTLPTPLASGGQMVPGRPYWVGEKGPELVTPTRPGYVNPAGSGITINVVGAQTGTIKAVSRQQALAAFDSVLRQMGVA